MKKIFLITVLILTASFSVLAAPAKDDQDAKIIKERLANIVKNDNQRAISGRVFEIEDKNILLEDTEGKKYKIKIDDVATSFKQIANKKPFSFANLEKNQYLIIVGSIMNDEVNAEEVYLDTSYVVRSGQIVKINDMEQSIEILTPDKDKFTIDIAGGKTSRSALNVKTMELESISFSAIREGDSIHFSSLRTAAEKSGSRFQANSIVIIPREYFIKGD